MPSVRDDTFWKADLTEAATLMVEIIRELTPAVIVTYDEFGNYGHPDHVQAHRVAMYAAQLAAVPSYRRDLGEHWEIAKIYWGAMSESRMRAGLRMLRDAVEPRLGGEELIRQFYTKWFAIDMAVRDLFPPDLGTQFTVFSQAMAWLFGELVDQRAELGAGIGSGAHRQLLRAAYERVEERLRHRLQDVDALHRGADLAGVGEGA